MPTNKSRTRLSQKGTALIETTLGLLVVLFIAGLCLEVAQVHQIRYLLSLALQEAARIAAVTRANPTHWHPVLARGVRLTYASRRSQTNHAQLTRRSGLEPFCAEIVSPTRTGKASTQGVRTHPRREHAPDTVLHLRLIYIYAPKQPWVAAAIKAMHRRDTKPTRPACAKLAQARAAGFIPVVVEYKVLMQSELPD
ncbi:hypothetical protein KZZ10_12030 [Alcaligenaceae bacterium LF4-65]|uniref:Uncharacterized protein n=1 Tax=Zwartia hollandica TaxID=324606 RepID=A0A953NDJ6_9BURK|nr:hypothetical protein [Zwartia hollandica]MBZ1351375.1 hypothetical protein [Zwartia hollandica]